MIYLYHFQSNEAIHYKIDDVSMNFQVGNHHTLRITNAQTFHEIKFTRNTQVRGLSIYLENNWIEKHSRGRVSEVFQYLKQVNYFEQFLNARQKRIMNEMVDMPVDHPYADIYIKSRLYRIVDKLFENFLQRDISESPEKLSEDDFQMLQKIETILTQRYEDSFPGIENYHGYR